MIVTFPSITSTCCLLGFVTYPLSLLQNYENLICSVLRFIFQIFLTLPYTGLKSLNLALIITPDRAP